ncbi:Phospholipase/carboxylesterase/thioesterase, partial [Zychaea mexicana]|uniref:Phospholipase/carboxylesterase/thioesterase n=1 Tax=Zychaea mexicana TaxID=64656 RepID=UPI0022FE23B3
AVNELIQAGIDSGTPSDRIILCAFSQVITLLTGYSTHHKLAGVIGCSGWLAHICSFFIIGTETNKKIIFFLCHGDKDMIVKPRYSQATAKYFNKIGFQATFKLYPGLGHAAWLQEIGDIASSIKQQLPL